MDVRKKFLSMLLGGMILFSGSNLLALDCQKEAKNINDTLKFYLLSGLNKKEAEIFNFDFKVSSVREVKVNNLKLCEVVFSVVPKGQNKNQDFVMKQIGYLGDGFMIFGDIRVKEGDKVRLITQERNREVNKEFFAMIEKQKQEDKANLLKKFEGEEQNLKNLVDVWLGGKDVNTVVYLFVDPYCSHCKHMKEVVKKFVDEGKLRVGLIFTPLGQRSFKIVSHALCSKDEKERFRIFQEREEGGSCESGQIKARKNYEYLTSKGGRGVPYGVWYKNGKVIEVTEGSVNESIVENIIQR